MRLRLVDEYFEFLQRKVVTLLLLLFLTWILRLFLRTAIKPNRSSFYLRSRNERTMFVGQRRRNRRISVTVICFFGSKSIRNFFFAMSKNRPTNVFKKETNASLRLKSYNNVSSCVPIATKTCVCVLRFVYSDKFLSKLYCTTANLIVRAVGRRRKFQVSGSQAKIEQKYRK